MKKKLLIILYQDLSHLIKKGEIVKRYYNPNNIFDEVHYLLINQNFVNSSVLKKLSGRAKVFQYSLNINYFNKVNIIFNIINFQNFDKIINKINPTVIRCYNISYAIFLAYIANKKFRIPYIISLHGGYIDEVSKYLFLKEFYLKLFYHR